MISQDIGDDSSKPQGAPQLRRADMAGIRDPAFWRRFSLAVHLDEEKAGSCYHADAAASPASSRPSQLKHTYVENSFAVPAAVPGSDPTSLYISLSLSLSLSFYTDVILFFFLLLETHGSNETQRNERG